MIIIRREDNKAFRYKELMSIDASSTEIVKFTEWLLDRSTDPEMPTWMKDMSDVELKQLRDSKQFHAVGTEQELYNFHEGLENYEYLFTATNVIPSILGVDVENYALNIEWKGPNGISITFSQI